MGEPVSGKGPLTRLKPAVPMLVSWAVTLADPTEVGTVVRLTFSRPGYRVSSTDPAVTVVASGTQVVVDVAVGGTFGATHGFALLPIW